MSMKHEAEPRASAELRAYRRLTRALRELPPITAPPGLGERALARVRGTSAEVRFSTIGTELGDIYVAYGPRGIRFVAPSESPEAFATAYSRRFEAAPMEDDAPPERLLRDVVGALSGDRRAARRLPLDLEPLSEFDRAVLLKALEIPRGEVRTYGWVAREIGRPTAARAVGRALGANPIPFIIPCHRVVGSGGSLTGYAFGLPMKRGVLALEGLDPAEIEAAERRGERFRGCRSTRIFCFPTCRHARRVQSANVVPFRSQAEAQAAGYRACRVCRPAAVAV